MKKRLVNLSLILAVAFGGFTMSAQTTTDKKESTEQTCPGCDKGCCKEKGNDRKGKKRDHKGNKRHGQAPRHADLFEGITLTPEQQSQLQALKSERKEDATRGDKKSRPSREDRAAKMAEFNAKVQQILTPEQWAVYQQNVEKMKAKRNKRR